MDKKIVKSVKNLKSKYKKEGFIILGVFGSYARGDENQESDIDLLYEMTDKFYKKYPGWDAIPVIEKIEQELEQELGKKVDLANKNALNEIGKKYILPEVKYV
jgi:hypothetical protein